MKTQSHVPWGIVLSVSVCVCCLWHLTLSRVPTDTMTGRADFYADQYHLNEWASPGSQWMTDERTNYRGILRVDAHDISEWLARVFFQVEWATDWQSGAAHQYLVERRDGDGKRVISISLEVLPLLDLLDAAGLSLLTVIAYVAVASLVMYQFPSLPIRVPLMIAACGAILDLAWSTFGVPMSYIALREPFWMQLGLHSIALTLVMGSTLHLALFFPRPFDNDRQRRWLLWGGYALYPLGVLLVSTTSSVLVDRFVGLRDWQMQSTILIKALSYLIWAAQYRQASVSQRGQMHWILMAVTVTDLVSMAQVFSRGSDLTPLQSLFNVLVPLGYGIALLPGRSLRLALGSTSGFIHGVANTLTLALFLCGLGLAANALVNANRITDLPLITVVLAAGFALTTVPLANLLREQFDSWFQGTRSAQRALLYQFTQRISENIALSDITQAFYDALEQGVQPTNACLWLWNDEAQALQPVGTNTLTAVDPVLYEHLSEMSVFTFTSQVERWPEIQAYHGLIALVVSRKLVGVCAIGLRVDGRPYSVEAVRFFETLTRSATLALRNAQLVGQLEDKIVALRRSYHQFMTAQEDERRRLASELHDATLQQLAHVNLLAGGLYSHLGPGGTGMVKDLQSILRSAEKQLRDILRGVHPAVLTDLGLIPALRSWLPHPEHLTVELTTQGFDDKRLPDPALELTLYRLCQESVNNALKHAQAHRIDVKMTWDENLVILEVIDDGIGFEPAALASRLQAQHGHFGLTNLRERVSALNGQLTMTSHPGHGTHIRAVLLLQTTSSRIHS